MRSTGAATAPVVAHLKSELDSYRDLRNEIRSDDQRLYEMLHSFIETNNGTILIHKKIWAATDDGAATRLYESATAVKSGSMLPGTSVEDLLRQSPEVKKVALDTAAYSNLIDRLNALAEGDSPVDGAGYVLSYGRAVKASMDEAKKKASETGAQKPAPPTAGAQE
jgi:hypothetical protein